MNGRGIGLVCLLLGAVGCPGDDTTGDGGSDSGSSTGGTTMPMVTTLGNDNTDGGTVNDGTADGTDTGTTAVTTATTDTGDTDDPTGSTETGSTETGSTETGSTETGSTETGSTETGDTGETDTGGTDTTDTGEPGDCMGPPPDMMCDMPSPYEANGECDPYAQDCPDGEKCMPFAAGGFTSWDSTTCSPVVDDPAQLGDSCIVETSGTSGVDDCDVGLMCWNVDVETLIGECVELCGCGPEEPTCSGGGTNCVIVNDGVLPLCLGVCDPLADDCLDNEVCVGVPDDTLGLPADYFFCAPDASGETQAGDPCEFLNVCPVGTMCLEASQLPVGSCVGSGCCTEICDENNGGAECTIAGTDCIGLFEDGSEPEACLAEVGYCGDPAP